MVTYNNPDGWIRHDDWGGPSFCLMNTPQNRARNRATGHSCGQYWIVCWTFNVSELCHSSLKLASPGLKEWLYFRPSKSTSIQVYPDVYWWSGEHMIGHKFSSWSKFNWWRQCFHHRLQTCKTRNLQTESQQLETQPWINVECTITLSGH